MERILHKPRKDRHSILGWCQSCSTSTGRNVEPSSIQQSRLSRRNNHSDQGKKSKMAGDARSERKHPSGLFLLVMNEVPLRVHAARKEDLLCRRRRTMQRSSQSSGLLVVWERGTHLVWKDHAFCADTKVSQGVRDTRRLDASQKTHSSQMFFAKPRFQPALHNVHLIPKPRWQILFILVMICQSFLGCRNFFANRTSGNCDIFWSISRGTTSIVVHSGENGPLAVDLRRQSQF